MNGNWFRSSYSTGNGGECVEAAWVKSSYSGAEGGQCLEVAAVPGAILVRDSKQPAAARLTFGAGAWAGFVEMAAGR
ncbi:DUF397 domain-containing protein [Streptomyces sp. C1-2]|uniref:DUF397 domain-containing protein n=1 Tax=Streptomyces sp. C1-2 TaxID=2720022 RepID=UPI0014323555|nr:DUF397 domain-containing protein [Streptomyces sp. C1-2]NJP74449.1 DUF397 domain-containing protein [Streptomyces sp. C1-2]